MIDGAALTEMERIVLDAALRIYVAETERSRRALVDRVSQRSYDAAVVTALDLLCSLDGQ